MHIYIFLINILLTQTTHSLVFSAFLIYLDSRRNTIEMKGACFSEELLVFSSYVIWYLWDKIKYYFSL